MAKRRKSSDEQFERDLEQTMDKVAEEWFNEVLNDDTFEKSQMGIEYAQCVSDDDFIAWRKKWFPEDFTPEGDPIWDEIKIN